MAQSEFISVMLYYVRGGDLALCQFASTVKFFNESYCISCTGNDDGSDRCVTCLGRRKSDDSNGMSRVHIGKERISHLFPRQL